MALGITAIEIMTLTAMQCDLQYTSMRLSDDLQCQQMYNSEQLKQMNKEHERNMNAIRAKYDPKNAVSYTDPTKISDVGKKAEQVLENSNVTTNFDANDTLNTTDPTNNVASEVAKETQAETQRSTESYMQEMQELQNEQTRHDNKVSNLTAENTRKESDIEQELTHTEARLKSINANLESLEKLRDTICKNFGCKWV